ncbi:hypothetical protein [Halopiger thermotolerans]
MGRTDDSDDATSRSDTGSMGARRWAIAANFRKPADYGIPTAPAVPTERCADGTLIVVDPDDSRRVMTVANPVAVRR